MERQRKENESWGDRERKMNQRDREWKMNQRDRERKMPALFVEEEVKDILLSC
jgi:hypothetical protein